MLVDESTELVGVLRRNLSRDDAVEIQLPPLDRVGDAAGHPGARVPPHRTERNGDAAGHVLAEVVARAFHHGDRA